MSTSGERTPTPPEVLRLIERMTPAGRVALMSLLGGRTDLTGRYAVVPADYLRLVKESYPRQLDVLRATLGLLTRVGNEAHRRGAGGRSRNVVDERNEVIGDLIEQGMTEPEQIRRHLIEHKTRLVEKKKARRGKPAEYIDAEMMMRQYRWPRRR
jgi:hypothetical protein